MNYKIAAKAALEKIASAMKALVVFLGPTAAAWIKWVWKKLMAGIDYMRASCIALVSLKAAWAACVAVFVGGYILGHGVGRTGKADLRREIASVTRAKDAAIVRSETLAAANREALIQIKKLKGEKEAALAELERAKSLRPTVRYVTRTVEKKAATSAPAATWWPFQ